MGRLLTLSDFVATHARVHPDKIGARDSKRALSYRGLGRARQPAGQRAAGPRSRQGRSGRAAGLQLVEWLEIYVALARAGLVAVPINFRLVGPEIAYIVEHSEARAFIVQDELRGVVEGIRAALPIERRPLRAVRCRSAAGLAPATRR